MFLTILFAAGSILVFSLILAFVARRLFLQADDTNGFLFDHNLPLRAGVSNVGSLLSATSLLFAFFPALLAWGGLPVIALVIGVLLGFALIVITARRAVRSKILTSSPTEPSCVSFLHMFQPNIQNALFWNQVFLYVSVMAIEFSLAIELARLTLSGSRVLATTIVFILCLLCLTYVNLGGFIGVLLTDTFQVLVFAYGAFRLARIASSVQPHPTPAIPTSHVSIGYSILVFFASLLVVVSYNLGWPDVWTRNITTLPVRTSRTGVLPLGVGAILIGVVTIPLIEIGKVLRSTAPSIPSGLDVRLVIDTFARLFDGQSLLSSSTLWWIVSAVVVAIVTTLDTWVLGLAQCASVLPDSGRAPIARMTVIPYLASFAIACMTGTRLIPWLGVMASAFAFTNIAAIISRVWLTMSSRAILSIIAFSTILQFVVVLGFSMEAASLGRLLPLLTICQSFVVVFTVSVVWVFKVGKYA